MDKEQEIKEISEIVNYCIYQYSSNPYQPDKNMNNCIASDLVLRGYGNKKQAVKEFADKLKDWLNGCNVIFYGVVGEMILDSEEVQHKIDKILKDFMGREKANG